MAAVTALAEGKRLALVGNNVAYDEIRQGPSAGLTSLFSGIDPQTAWADVDCPFTVSSLLATPDDSVNARLTTPAYSKGVVLSGHRQHPHKRWIWDKDHHVRRKQGDLHPDSRCQINLSAPRPAIPRSG